MDFLKKNRNHNHHFLLQICFLTIGILFFQIQTLFPQQVKLGWDPSINPDILSYNIYRTNHVDSSFSLVNTIAHPDSTYMDNNLEWNTHYYYVATSIDKFANESGFSNMIDTTLILRTTINQIGLNGRLIENNNVILEWSIPYNSGIAGVELYRSKQDTNSFQKIRYIPINPDAMQSVENHFTDEDLPPGKYYYRLKQIKLDNSYQYSEIISISVSMPLEFNLFQNSPNPFNSSTTISYTLPQCGAVELKIYNINGEEVSTLVDEFQNAGYQSMVWNGLDKNGVAVTSGMYYIRLKSSNQSQFRRMLLIK